MKTKLFLSLFAFLALTGCLDDDTPEDKVETVNVAISAMTYIDSPVMTNYPIEGMRQKWGTMPITSSCILRKSKASPSSRAMRMNCR